MLYLAQIHKNDFLDQYQLRLLARQESKNYINQRNTMGRSRYHVLGTQPHFLTCTFSRSQSPTGNAIIEALPQPPYQYQSKKYNGTQPLSCIRNSTALPHLHINQLDAISRSQSPISRSQSPTGNAIIEALPQPPYQYQSKKYNGTQSLSCIRNSTALPHLHINQLDAIIWQHGNCPNYLKFP
ncbi:hypothetical protein [Aphanizomenon flos-aquae]|jgi:hypothetical protein|uniref:hypothetical protein n=1 Tax=Aphanizomenon flos-aquae TaxID=1176 RepID=UPI001F559F87|nr:hypothetical protein [Aphanizomenon flos-aquae]